MISVIMSVYKEHVNVLRKSIESILNQDYSIFELIIILDDPDNIDAECLIRHYAEADTRIVFCKNEKNKGLVESLNKALRLCKGEYVARMDADDISLKQRLKEEMAFLLENDLDLVGSKIIRIDENDAILSRDMSYYSNNSVKKILHYTDCVPHPTWLCKKIVYEELDGYREITACEDYDFLLRAQAKGFKIGIINEELLYYRLNAHGISSSNALRQLLTTRYLSKNRKEILAISQKDIVDTIDLTDRDEQKYNKAHQFFLRAADGKGLMLRIWNIIRSIIHSKYIIYNYFQLSAKRFILMKNGAEE